MTSVPSPASSEVGFKYEKYVVERGGVHSVIREGKPVRENYYLISRVDHAGNKLIRYSPEESMKMLRSGTFAGSVLLCRNPEHTGALHKLIYAIQKMNSRIFRPQKDYDLNLTHAAIILGAGVRTEQYNVAPLAVAHADYPGVVKENYDFLADHDCTSLVIYKPVDEKMKELFLETAHQTSYTLEDTKKYENKLPADLLSGHRMSAEVKAKYSFFSGSRSVFWRTLFSSCGTKGKAIHEKLARQTGFLVADLLLQDQIRTARRGAARNFICSGYAASVLGGAAMMYGLKDCSQKQIATFMTNEKGQLLSRKTLAKKITEAITRGGEDPIAKALHETYAAVKIARVDPTGKILPIHLGRELDKAVDDSLSPSSK